MSFKKKKIKLVDAVLRYQGSKKRKVTTFIKILDLNSEDTFLDMFGGSGIVGVNVQYLTKAKVTINDFDNNFPLNTLKAMTNVCSFQGMKKYFTKAANEYAIKRVDNGYWDKYDKYNNYIGLCEIIHKSFENIDMSKFNKVYVDPPYFGIKNIYQESLDTKQHIALKEKLDANIDGKKILISYNDKPFIRELYNDKRWYINTLEFQYQTGWMNRTNKKIKVNELIITNFKLEKNE